MSSITDYSFYMCFDPVFRKIHMLLLFCIQHSKKQVARIVVRRAFLIGGALLQSLTGFYRYFLNNVDTHQAPLTAQLPKSNADIA